jgi:hypothetical protein
VQERGNAREKDKSWCAIVRNKASQKQQRICLGKVSGIEAQRIGVEEIAHMIERHEQDDEPAHPVNSLQPGDRLRGNARYGFARSRYSIVKCVSQLTAPPSTHYTIGAFKAVEPAHFWLPANDCLAANLARWTQTSAQLYA